MRFLSRRCGVFEPTKVSARPSRESDLAGQKRCYAGQSGSSALPYWRGGAAAPPKLTSSPQQFRARTGSRASKTRTEIHMNFLVENPSRFNSLAPPPYKFGKGAVSRPPRNNSPPRLSRFSSLRLHRGILAPEQRQQPLVRRPAEAVPARVPRPLRHQVQLRRPRRAK